MVYLHMCLCIMCVPGTHGAQRLKTSFRTCGNLNLQSGFRNGHSCCTSIASFVTFFFSLSTQRVPITCHLSFLVLSRLIDSVSEWQRQIRVAGARGSRACLYDRISE